MKSIHTILISIVATAIIVGGGTYYFINAKATKDKNNLQSQITDLNKKLADGQATSTNATNPTNTSTTTPDPIADWTTYTNKEFGFSFKYPKDWELIASPNQTHVNLVNSGGGSVAALKHTDGNIEDGFIDFVVVSFKENSLKDYFNNYVKRSPRTGYANISAKDVTLGNVPAILQEYEITKDNHEMGGAGPTYYKEYYLIKDDVLWHFYFSAPPESKGLTKVYDQVLTTFKFTN